MKTIYRCRECGEELKGLSISAKISNTGTVDELIHHFDPCPCYESVDDLSFKVGYLEQENSKLKAQLENTRLGLEKMGKLLSKTGPGPYDQNYLAYQDNEWHIFRWDGEGLAHGKTLADLLDTITLLEIEE